MAKNTNRRRRRNDTSVYNIEKELNVFVIGLYRKDKRGYRNWRQRAILVTLYGESAVKNDVQLLADKITELEGGDEPYKTEVITENEFINVRGECRPQDSAIISIGSPLVIVKRSPKTGLYYWNDDYNYCPKSSIPLRYVIRASSDGKGICPELTRRATDEIPQIQST